MSNQFRREKIGNGVFFGSVIDPKFKHNRMTANLAVPLVRGEVTENAVVPFILRKGCRACPDFTQLNRRLCELYGASLSCDVSKYGAYQVLDVSIYGIDDRFTLDGEKMIEECARLLTDILLEPSIEAGAFDSEDTALEKQQLIDAIESQINDKRVYALSRCRVAMCEGEPFAVEKYGYIDDAQKITGKSAAKAYKRILKTAQVEIMFVGCGNPDTAKRIFSDAFAKVERAPISATPVLARPSAELVREKTDTFDVSQSKLVLGFRTGRWSTRREFGAMRMMVAIFGGTPNSRLFTYVREKLSLCYYCAARFDRLTGLMMVDSGVERKNKKLAQDEILRQLECVKNGDFDDEELSAARMILQTSLATVGDSLGALEEWYLTMTMVGEDSGESTPERESELLEAITREDIMAAAAKVTLDTVYFLTGKGEEQA